MSRHDVHSVEQFNALVNSGKTVVVDFTATWCGPCKRIAPKFEELAAQYPNAVFLKVDVDAEADIAQAQNVEAMPTFKFFQNGKVVQEVVGADINAIIAACAKYCA